MSRFAPLVRMLRLFLAEKRAAMAAGVALAAVAAGAGLALLGLSGWFITATALAGLVPATALMFDVFMPGAAIRFLAIARTFARYGERVVTHDATLGLLAALRARLFRGFARPDLARALASRPARLLFRLTADVDALDTVYLRLMVPAGAAVATALGLGVGLAFLSPALGLAAAGLLLVSGLGLPLWLARAAEREARRRAAALEALRVRVAELTAGQVAFAMAGRLAAQVDAAHAAEARLTASDIALNRLETLAAAGFGVAAAVLLAAAAWAAAQLAAAGDISAPQAALILLLALAALEPFAALRRGAVEFGRSARAAARLSPALDPPPPPARPAPPPGLVLRIAGLRYTPPGADAPLFDGLDLAIAEGEHVALIGPSGAGKSTLFALILGELVPDAGTIAALPTAVLGQRVELFRDTIRGNLTLGRADVDDAALWQALAAAGLEEVVRALPGGLDASLGEGGEGLSEGQKRRLALARLLVRASPLWLLDEPTEALDAGTATLVLTQIKTIGQGRTIFTNAHLRREAELADRLIRLEAGRVVADVRRGEPGFAEMLATLRPG